MLFFRMLSDEGLHREANQLSSFCDFLFISCYSSELTFLPFQIEDMKKHLERKVKAGKSKPKLKDIDPDILPAAWSILRWSAPFPSCRRHPAYCSTHRCVASCTAHIEAIDSGEELIKNLGEFANVASMNMRVYSGNVG